MAEKEVIVSEYTLCCSICLEQFIQPRTLPCQHSLCTLCLTGYIEQVNKSVVGSKLGFNCPCCRVLISIPDGDIDIQKWVDTFPVNFTLLSILDSRKEKMATPSVLCEACARSNVDKNATFYCLECEENLCDDCNTYHYRNKTSSTHRLYAIEPNNDTQVRFDVLKNLGNCSKHTNLDVKFHCVDHDEYICYKCAIAHHRKCVDLITIEEKVETLGAGNKKLNERLDTVAKSFDELLEFYQGQEVSLDKTKKTIDTQVTEIESNIKKSFYDFKNRIDQQYKELFKQKKSQISDGKANIETLKDTIGNSKQLLDIASEYGNTVQQHFANKKLENVIREMEHSLQSSYSLLKSEEIQLSGVQDLNSDLQKTLDKITLNVKNVAEHLPKCPLIKHKPFSKRQAVLEMEMSVEGTTLIDDCTCISSDLVFVSDRGRNSVSLIDITKKEVVTRHQLSSEPWNVAKLDRSRVGVVFPVEKRIRIMKIEGTNICIDKEINVSGACYGLTYCSRTSVFYTILRTSGDIARIKEDGTNLTPIPLSSETKSDIKLSYCLYYSERRRLIFVSCYDKHKIIALNASGDVMFEIIRGKNPWEISLDYEDNIYVCLYGSHGLDQHDKSGNFIKAILASGDNVYNAKCIAWRDNMESFILATNSMIKSYKFS